MELAGKHDPPSPVSMKGTPKARTEAATAAEIVSLLVELAAPYALVESFVSWQDS